MGPAVHLQAPRSANTFLNQAGLRNVSAVPYTDPLAPITSLINTYLPCRTSGTFIELGGHAGRLNLAERMSQQGWTGVGFGRADVLADTYRRVEDYRDALLELSPSSANVIVARLSFYPTLSEDTPRVYPWDALNLDQRGIIAMCETQYLPHPMLFPIRRALADNGLFIRTIRAAGLGTSAEIPAETARRSGLFIEHSQLEEFEGGHYYTTVYRAAPRVDFGRVLIGLNEEDWRTFDYEFFLRAAIKHPDISVTARHEGSATLWSVTSHERFLRIMETGTAGLRR